jgi:hypothetical protein
MPTIPSRDTTQFHSKQALARPVCFRGEWLMWMCVHVRSTAATDCCTVFPGWFELLGPAPRASHLCCCYERVACEACGNMNFKLGLVSCVKGLLSVCVCGPVHHAGAHTHLALLTRTCAASCATRSRSHFECGSCCNTRPCAHMAEICLARNPRTLVCLCAWVCSCVWRQK